MLVLKVLSLEWLGHSAFRVNILLGVKLVFLIYYYDVCARLTQIIVL